MEPDLREEYQWVYDLLVAAVGEDAVTMDHWNNGQNLSYMIWKRPEPAPDNPYCWLMQMAPEKVESTIEHKGYTIRSSKPLGALQALSGIEQYARQVLPYVVEYRFNDQPDKLNEAALEVEKIKQWFATT